MHNAPEKIKEHLFLNSSKFINFKDVKREVVQFLRSKRTYEHRRDKNPDKTHPMDIDEIKGGKKGKKGKGCLLYTSPSPRDLSTSRMPSSA